MDSDSGLDAPSQYAVVCFLPRKRDGADEIDLVPYSWVDIKNDNLVCSYPNTRKDLKKREKYLQNLTPPKDSWPQCEVEIISCVDTLERGKRHLKRAETTLKVDTDNPTNSSNPENIVQFSNHEINRELDNPTNSSNPENIVQFSNHEINRELDNVESMSSLLSLHKDTGTSLIHKNKSEKSCETLDHSGVRTADQQPVLIDDDESFERVKAYIDNKFSELYDKLNTMKLSTEYTIKNEAKNIKTQIIMHSAASIPKMNKTTAMEPYKAIFPIADYEQFVKFDEELTSPDERDKLKNLFKVLIYGETDTMMIIRKTISEVITPTVQLRYSGTGRVVRGVGKLNFSSTYTYTCLKDIVEEKFGDSEQTKNLRNKVGIFLANAGDRNGGRRQRPNN